MRSRKQELLNLRRMHRENSADVLEEQESQMDGISEHLVDNEIKVGDWVEDKASREKGKVVDKTTGIRNWLVVDFGGIAGLEGYAEDLLRKLSLDELPPEAWDEGRRHVLEKHDTDKLTEDEKASARQHGGNHYKKYPIQPYEYCFVNKLNNLQSEAISYITRYKDKGGKQDLEKAIHTLELLIEAEYDDE